MCFKFGNIEYSFECLVARKIYLKCESHIFIQNINLCGFLQDLHLHNTNCWIYGIKTAMESVCIFI